jgi:hypothetical protein
MPFGLDLKSLIVGMLIAYFLVPYVLGFVASKKTPGARTPAV